MSVGFGSPLSSANTNAAFVSRIQDTDMLGRLDNNNAADSTSTSTGAIHTTGGLGVEKQAHIEQVFVESLAGNFALTTDVNKQIVESSTTDAELANLAGTTSPIQPQLDGKANDADVVHNTGDESISGIKTFTDDMVADADLVVNGNLTVNGTTTTLNTATLDVEDTNITVNKTGNDASAEGAGLTVERTGTNGSLVYENALSSRFKAGDLGSESEVITAAAVQTMSGDKTFSAKLFAAGEIILSELIDSATTGSNATVNTTAPTVRLTNASLVSIENIDDAAAGKVVVLTNNTGNPIMVLNDTGGTAILRILTGTGANVVLNNHSSFWFSYDSVNTRWMIVGGTGSGTGGGYNSELRTISGGEETAKQLTLAGVPTDADKTHIIIKGAGGQFYGDDFTVTGNILDWSGLGLDGILTAGDKLTIVYN